MRCRMISPGRRLPLDAPMHQFLHLRRGRHRGQVRLKPNRRRTQLANDFRRLCQQRPPGNHDSRALHFLARLLRVAPIGEEHPPPSQEQQQPVAACVSAQVAQVRGMRHHKPVKLFVNQCLLEFLLPAASSPSPALYRRRSEPRRKLRYGRSNARCLSTRLLRRLNHQRLRRSACAPDKWCWCSRPPPPHPREQCSRPAPDSTQTESPVPHPIAA